MESAATTTSGVVNQPKPDSENLWVSGLPKGLKDRAKVRAAERNEFVSEAVRRFLEEYVK